MKPFNLQVLQQYSEHQINQTRGWIQQNWMKLVLVLMCTFILVKKDINVSFSLQAAGNNEELVQHQQSDMNKVAVGQTFESSRNNPDKKSPQKALETFSIIDLPSRLLKKKESTKNSDLHSKLSHAPSSNKANNFSNLGFVLNPSYAKRHQIDPAIVREKLQNCKDYIRRFSPVASAEMHKYGIPASITLAQALLESNAGDSRLTLRNSNHFGIKCFAKNCSTNHCSNFTDDSHKDFFRKYKNAWESYRAHSIFLQGKRYQHLNDLGSKNYVSWAKGLKKSGYATDKNYAKKLIEIIEAFELYQYDV